MSCQNSRLTPYHFLAAGVLILGQIIAIPTLASFSLNCEENSVTPEAQTVDDLIRQASFIGLYEAENISEIEVGESKVKGTVRTYGFTMTLSTALTKNAPKTIYVEAMRSHQAIPQTFFSLEERHKEIVETNDTFLGLAAKTEGKNGVCIFVPQFVLGYYYLIFGDSNSRASYEPVLSTRYDAFYREVREQIRDSN